MTDVVERALQALCLNGDCPITQLRWELIDKIGALQSEVTDLQSRNADLAQRLIDIDAQIEKAKEALCPDQLTPPTNERN